MTSRLRFAVLVAVVLLLPAARAAELRMTFTAGDKHEYIDQSALTLSRSTAGAAEDVEGFQMRSTNRIRQTVRTLDDGVATVDVDTVERQVETTPRGGTTTKDTSKVDGERVRITTLGRVLERIPRGDDKPETEDSAIDAFDVLQRVIDGIEFPTAQIEPGGTWTRQYDVNLTSLRTNGPRAQAKLEGSYLRDVTVRGRRCAELRIEVSAPLDIATPTDMGGMTYTSTGQVLAQVLMYLDLERGLSVVERATYGSHMVVKLKIEDTSVTMEETLKMNTRTHKVE